MIDQKLDDHHDLAYENGDFPRVSGSLEVAQAVRIKLLTVRYENWLDGTDGVPWNDGMFWHTMTEATKKTWISGQILSVFGVTGLSKLTYSEDKENHAPLIQVAIETAEGPVVYTS
jgi:hypothetical protein